MDLIKDIDKLAKDYTPAEVEEVATEGMYDMMKSAMTPPKDIKATDKLDLSKKGKKKKSLKSKLKETREQNGWV